MTTCVTSPGTLSSLLSDYEVLSMSSLKQHSVRKRDVQMHTHMERLLSFTALQRFVFLT